MTRRTASSASQIPGSHPDGHLVTSMSRLIAAPPSTRMHWVITRAGAPSSVRWWRVTVTSGLSAAGSWAKAAALSAQIDRGPSPV
ncbi:hypothetical protein [Rhodococcus phenolicus]|uniref:hypothetical protein n=1 Tax=Rhodococcus phenolicus TaxID=263849 RepID=UPI00082CDAC2|nr:hypothetical protein [Rhodococcus phenolicus]